jgi:diamine N-acetyltransferase
MEIQPLDLAHIPCALEVIRQSFRTVAEEFGLTPENCPTHPAFLTAARLSGHMADGLQLFGCYAGELLAGVIGIKQRSPREFEIEKLAVLSEYRHRGIGATFMLFASEQIVREGGEKACIGIVDENAMLKQWYVRQGFIVIETKRFPHLPFAVCFMEKPMST